MLGLSGNQSFHTETSYRKSGGSQCANHPQHLPTPFKVFTIRIAPSYRQDGAMKLAIS